MKTKTYVQEMVVRARRLLQYFQFPDKKFSQYFEGYLLFFAAFQNSYVFIPPRLSRPLTMFCETLF